MLVIYVDETLDSQLKNSERCKYKIYKFILSCSTNIFGCKSLLVDVAETQEGFDLDQSVDNTVCILCTEVTQKIKAIVNTEDKRRNLLTAVSNACHIIPPIFRGVCRMMTNTYGRFVVNILENSSTQEICQMVEFCLSQEVFNAVIENVQLLSMEQDTRDGFVKPLRWICECVLSSIEKLVDSKEKRSNLMHTMLFGCDLLPSFIRNPCTYFVESFVPIGLNMLSSLHPAEFCEFLPFYPGVTGLDNYDNTTQ